MSRVTSKRLLIRELFECTDLITRPVPTVCWYMPMSRWNDAAVRIYDFVCFEYQRAERALLCFEHCCGAWCGEHGVVWVEFIGVKFAVQQVERWGWKGSGEGMTRCDGEDRLELLVDCGSVL